MPERPTLGEPVRHGYSAVEKRLGVASRFVSWQDARVLDVGCGNGAYTARIAQDARLAVGVDLEYGRLREFRSQADGVSNLALAQAAAESLPFPEETFDMVFCIETLEHVLDERRSLGEIRRVLRPEGIVLLTVPNKWYIFETHGLRPRWLLGSNRYPFASWLPPPIHSRLSNARIYTANGIRSLLAQAGFQVVGFDWMLPPLDKVGIAPLRGAMRRALRVAEQTWLRRFGVSVVIAGRKVDGQPSPGS